jgi:hypothetical protein
MTYNAVVCKITNLRPIPKADRLLVGECLHQDVVVGIDTKEGDIGLFYGADGRLTDGYLKANKLIRTVHPDGSKTGTFDENGKIRIQKLRGQKSNGYFTTLDSLRYTGGDINSLKEGTELNEFNGVKFCEKYTVAPKEFKKGSSPNLLKSKFLFFHEHKDTKRILYKLDEIEVGMELTFTEKLHGTSQRSALSLESQQSWWGTLINGVCKRTIIKPTLAYKHVCGTRRTVIKDWKRHTGFYQEKEGFRKEADDLFFGKLAQGETVYYEVVGYTRGASLIMPTGSTEKLQDKAMLKKYGKEMNFTYGCDEGEHKVFVYRMSITDIDGNEKDYMWDEMESRCMVIGVKTVPLLLRGKFEGDIDLLVDTCKKLADGESTLDYRHIKEGIVVRNDVPYYEGWKYKSFEFDILEDTIKLEGKEDIEEMQDA